MGNCTSTTSVHVHHPSAPGSLEIYRGNGEGVKYYPLSDSDVPYSIRFINDTDQDYYFAIYQDFPDSPGLRSIAWQVRRLPRRGSAPTTSKVSWTMSYGISIANWDSDEKEYTGEQQQDADLDNTYEVINRDDFPSINPESIGRTAEGQILFKNNTKPPNAMDLDMGFTVAGNIVAVQPKVHSLEATIFDVHPSYYVALYRKIKLGQLVDSGVVVGPVDVKFTDGKTRKSVSAYMNAGQYKLKVF